MWKYEKRLQYPVNISTPNPRLAQVIISQFGGPDGELAASQRYLAQRYTMPYKECKGLLTDIGSEASEMGISEFCCRKAPLMRQHFQINIYMVFIAHYHLVEYLGIVFVLVLDTVNQLAGDVLYILHQFLLFQYHCLLLPGSLRHRL